MISGAAGQSDLQRGALTRQRLAATGQEVLHRGGAALGAALQSGSVREAAASVPQPARTTLLHAYRIGFSHTFNEIMVIGALVALAGGVLTLILVRQRDFVHNLTGATRGETGSAAGSGPAGVDAPAASSH